MCEATIILSKFLGCILASWPLTLMRSCCLVKAPKSLQQFRALGFSTIYSKFYIGIVKSYLKGAKTYDVVSSKSSYIPVSKPSIKILKIAYYIFAIYDPY